MGTEIFKIDAPWAQKLTKMRVPFLMTSTVSLLVSRKILFKILILSQGICRETGEMFLVECPDRKKPTLEALIIANVADGTTIYTDGWQSYRKLDSCGHDYKVTLLIILGNNTVSNISMFFFQWDMVNHSEHFVNPKNKKVHTQVC